MPELDPRVTAAACEAHDGFSPLNDSARLVLDRARKGEVWARQDGFAILDDHEYILEAFSGFYLRFLLNQKNSQDAPRMLLYTPHYQPFPLVL